MGPNFLYERHARAQAISGLHLTAEMIHPDTPSVALTFVILGP